MVIVSALVFPGIRPTPVRSLLVAEFFTRGKQGKGEKEMVVAITRNQDSGTVHPGPNILSTGDPAAAKRYIKALVQTGSAATDNSATYDEMEVVRQTASLETSELRRLLGAIAEELQTELTTRVNEEFEGFVSLFKDIGAMGEEEFIVLADKVALIQALAHVPS